MDSEEVFSNQPSQRVLAAGVASVLSTLVVTPFDVVKTRMQTSAAAGPASTSGSFRHYCYQTLPRSSNDLAASWFAPHKLYKRVKARLRQCSTSAMSSMRYTSAMLEDGLALCPTCYPATPARAPSSSNNWACTLSANRPQQLSMLKTMQRIVKMEGASVLWRGLDSAMLMSIPMVGIYMPLYDHLSAAWGPSLGWYTPAVAGMSARTAAAFCVAPLELIRTRQQALTASSGSTSSSGSLSEAIRALTREMRLAAASSSGAGAGSPPPGATSRSGCSVWGRFTPRAAAVPRVQHLWTGFAATLARDVPFTAIYWCCVEAMRERLLKNHAQAAGLPVLGSLPASPSGRTAQLTHVFAANLTAGALSGAFAAALTTPFDVVKTRMQTSSTPSRSRIAAAMAASSRGSSSGGRGTWVLHGATQAPGSAPGQGLLDVLRSVYQTEGVRGLFTGMGPRVARAAPACAIVIASYEVLKAQM